MAKQTSIQSLVDRDSTTVDQTSECVGDDQHDEAPNQPLRSVPNSATGGSFVNLRSMTGNLDPHTDAASEEWIERMEETGQPHAYYSIIGVTASSLSGIETAVDIKRSTKTNSDGQLHTSYGGGLTGVPHPEKVSNATYLQAILEKAVDWKLSLLAYPEHPLARPIPDEDVRILIAPMIKDAMKKAGVAVDQVLAEAKKIESPPATDGYIQSIKRVNALPSYRHDSEVRRPRRAVSDLEHVVKCRFGVANERSAFDYEQYESFSLNCLKSKLDTARGALEAVDRRRNELSKGQSVYRSTWIEEQMQSTFAELF